MKYVNKNTLANFHKSNNREIYQTYTDLKNEGYFIKTISTARLSAVNKHYLSNKVSKTILHEKF